MKADSISQDSCNTSDQAPPNDTRQRLRSFRRLPERRVWLLLATAIVLTVVEGAIRKWLLGNDVGRWNYAAYFSKDIVFGCLLFLPSNGSSRSVGLESFEFWLFTGCVMLVGGAVLGAFHQINYAGALLTMRAAIVLPLVAFMAIPRLVGVRLGWVAGLMAVLTILNFGLGLVQNQLSSDHFLNRYAATDMEIVALESGVRATGTFSYITGLELMSSVGVWAGLVLVSVARSKPARALAILSLIAGVGCALVSISRAPVAVAGAMLIGWVLLSRSARSRLWNNAGMIALVTSILFATGASGVFKGLWGGLVDRHVAAGDSVHDRSFGQFHEMWLALRAAPFGQGFGTEQVGGNYASSGSMTFTNYESQFPRIVMETGFLGFAGFLAVCVGAIAALQRARSDAASAGRKDAILATQLLLAIFFYSNVVFNHTASSFAWMLFAAVLAGTASLDPASSAIAHGSKRKTRRRLRRSRLAAGCGDDRDGAGQGATT